MRSHILALAALSVVSTVAAAHAQVYSLPTPPPRVHAAQAQWQRDREPLFYAGRFYRPTGPTEYFDGHVLVQTGTYRGVPLYENSTLEPYSVVFVPIGDNLVRPYERKRDGDLVGTAGSRMPSFPITRDAETTSVDGVEDFLRVSLPSSDRLGRAQWYWPTPTDQSAIASTDPLAPLSSQTRTLATPIIPPTLGRLRETTNAGAYVQFMGARFYTSGRAVTHDIQRFARIGDLGTAAVFGESGGSNKTVFVEVVPGGPLAPYTKR